MVFIFAQAEFHWQSKWFFRPRQGIGMTVEEYYIQFRDWKEEMISLSFPAEDEDYIDGFIENLRWDVRLRSSNYRSSRSGLINAFYNAKFEESMMFIDENLKKIKANRVAEGIRSELTVEEQLMQQPIEEQQVEAPLSTTSFEVTVKGQVNEDPNSAITSANLGVEVTGITQSSDEEIESATSMQIEANLHTSVEVNAAAESNPIVVEEISIQDVGGVANENAVNEGNKEDFSHEIDEGHLQILQMEAEEGKVIDEMFHPNTGHYVFDNLPKSVPTARQSFSLVSLFSNERNDNSLLNKAVNQMLDEVGQPFWLTMQGIKADQQLFDKMTERFPVQQRNGSDIHEKREPSVVDAHKVFDKMSKLRTQVSSFHISSKSMFVHMKNHVLDVDFWVDGILMFIFDPGGEFSPLMDSDVLKNDNALVEMGRETNENRGNFIAIVEVSVNENILWKVLENAFTYEENLIGANGYLEYELLVDAQLDCILVFHFVEIVINWRTSNVGSVDKVGKEWNGMALWYWSGNYLQATIVYYLKIIVVDDHCVTPSISAIMFLLEIPISGIPMVGLVSWQTNEVEYLRKSLGTIEGVCEGICLSRYPMIVFDPGGYGKLAWLWIESDISLLFDLSHVDYLVMCPGSHILKYIGRTSSVDETKRGVHFAYAVAVIIFMEPKPRRGHVDQIISICCILLKSFVDTKHRIPYILEDKDAFERVGMDTIRMGTTLGMIGLLTFQASDSECISLIGGKSIDCLVNEKLSFSYFKHEEGGKGSSSNMLARVLPSYNKQENIPIVVRKMTCIKRAVKVKVIADANFVMCWCAILNHDILPHIAIKIRYELATEIISIAGDDWKLETELGWGISQKVIGKEQSSLGDFRHGDSEMGSTLNIIAILLISNHHMFIGIDVKRFKRFDDDSGLHFAVKDLINKDMKPSPLLGPNVMNSLLVALEYASCCLPNGLRDTAGASPLPKGLDDIGLIPKTLLFSTAELEHYIWDPGSFVSVLQLLGQLLEGSWSCLGFSFHHLEDKAVVEGKDLSCPEVKKIRKKAKDASVTVGYELLAVRDAI